MRRYYGGAACAVVGVVFIVGWKGWKPVAGDAAEPRTPPPAVRAQRAPVKRARPALALRPAAGVIEESRSAVPTPPGGETRPPEESGETPGPVRMVAVGDLMLGTTVKQHILSRGPNYPFRRYRSLLRSADIAFGNLETPLSDRGTPTPGKSLESLRNNTNFIFRAPPSAAEGLAWAGFDVVSIANNHTMDYGGTALRDTLVHLKAAGVASVGGGMDLESAFEPVFLERQGQKFAVFAVSDVLPAFSVAGETTPGVAPGRGSAFVQYMPAAIARARKQADWVLVSVHWGKERFTGATPKQKRLGHRLVDWGADVVIGHHTHCMGPVERYRNSLIHYSLGNFISYLGSRSPVEAWEVTFEPGKRPQERSHAFRWDGARLARN